MCCKSYISEIEREQVIITIFNYLEAAERIQLNL